MWTVSPADVAVGSPFRALMDINRYNGIYDVPDAEWETYTASRLDEIRSGDISPREFRRADGRTSDLFRHDAFRRQAPVSYFDVTEMKRRETEAEEARRHLADVLESLPAGVVIYDRDDRFVLANRKLQDSLPGLKAVWQAGRTFRDAIELGHRRAISASAAIPQIDALYETDDSMRWLDAYMARHRLRHNVYRAPQSGRTLVPGLRHAHRRRHLHRRQGRHHRDEGARGGAARSMRRPNCIRHVLDELPVSTYVKRRI